MSIKEDFNNISSTVKMMDEQMQLLNTLVDTTIDSVHNLDMKIKKNLDNIHFDKILSMTDEEVEQFLIDSAEPKIEVDVTETPSGNALEYHGMHEEPSRANIEALQKNYAEAPDEWKDKPFYDYCRYVLKSIKDSLMEIKKIEAERDKLLEDMHKIEDDYFSYVNTKEYKDKKKEQLQKLKDAAAEEEDELKKAKILRDIEYMDNAENLRFLMERIDELGQREIDTIADSYFNTSRSVLIMKKFAARVPKLGYNKDIYKFFFNLEENFLPEEYHVFNNIFLFHVMRTISYMDVDSKRDNLYASTIMVRLYNLVYHRFGDQVLEDEFIEFIRKTVALFESWRDKFEKDNLTHPNHPARIEKDEEAKKKRRLFTISELKQHGVEPDTSKSTDELVEDLKAVIAKENEEKNAELNDWSAQHDSESSTGEEDSEETSEEEVTEDCDTEEILEEEPPKAIVIDSVPVAPEDSRQDIPEEAMDAINEVVEQIEESKDRMIEVEGTIETMEGEPGEFVQMNDDMPPVKGRGKTAGVISTIAYMDRYGYYYMQMPDGSYTYFTNEDKVYESGFKEEDILKLLNTGSVEKIIKTRSTH